jgi:hypothetical protein
MAMHSLVDTHVPEILVSIKNFSYDIQTSSRMIECLLMHKICTMLYICILYTHENNINRQEAALVYLQGTFYKDADQYQLPR